MTNLSSTWNTMRHATVILLAMAAANVEGQSRTAANRTGKAEYQLDDSGVKLMAPGSVPTDMRAYNQRDNYCWLSAHSSIAVGNKIWIDGGMSKYSVDIKGESFAVPDFNAFTLSLDLTSPFNVDSPPLTSYKKNPLDGTPVTNRGGLWANSTHLLTQGGHFYSAGLYNTSSYFVLKEAIPDYGIWAFPLNHTASPPVWTHIEHRVASSSASAQDVNPIERTVAGADTCDDEGKRCWWLSGFKNGRTDKLRAANWVQPTSALLEYNTETSELRNLTWSTGEPEEDGYGFAYGSLTYLPLPCTAFPSKQGLLVSVMSQRMKLQGGSERGDMLTAEPNNMTRVAVHSPVTGITHSVPAVLDPALTAARTRYCTAVAYDAALDEHDLYFYGGVSAHNDTPPSIHVLSLPAFVWSSLPIPAASPHLRSATCHFANSQLIVLGGAPITQTLDFSATTPCANTSLVQIFDTDKMAWADTFNPNATVYRRPERVRETVDRLRNATGVRPLAWYQGDRRCGIRNQTLFPDDEKLSAAQIAGIVVGALLGVFLVFSIGWLVKSAFKQPDSVIGSLGSVETGEGAVEMTESVKDGGRVAERERG